MDNTGAETPTMIPIATAIILQDSHSAGPFAVESLCPGALSLRGPSRASPTLGEAMVVLTTPGQEMLRLHGTVVQYEGWDDRCISVSLRLRPMDADLEDQVQDIVTRHLERSRMPMIVALDGGRLQALSFQRQVRALGRHAVFAQNSLDALWVLEKFSDLYGTVLIDHSFVEANGPEILVFLHDQYRDKRRVLVLPRGESRDAWDGTTWAVHEVLTTPWTAENLQSALGLFPGERTSASKRILFVDDEPAVLAGLQRRLRSDLRRHETVWVTSGEAALTEFRARPFDVVVSDLRMPGMDGVTLLRSIKSQSPQSKRIVLSGYESYSGIEVADVVLRKPCPADSLRLEVLGPP
jgi:CheY-like chemotaxis protein